MILRYYQIPAEKALRDSFRGILKSPAGSGKTVIGAAALDNWGWRNLIRKERKMRVAWVAMSIDQIDQGKRAVSARPRIARSCQVDFFCYAGCPSLAGYLPEPKQEKCAHSDEAEKGVLSSIMNSAISGNAAGRKAMFLAEQQIGSGHFINPANREIWNALKAIHSNNDPLNFIAVTTEMESAGIVCGHPGHSRRRRLTFMGTK